VARDLELSRMPPQVTGLTRRIQQRVPEWSQGWATRWELWLILALGAFLRLWQIQRTFWLGDQTDLLDLARRSILLRAIPVTGIPSSIGTFNAPLSIDVLLPVAAFTSDPLPQVIVMALWNVAGLAVCYVVAARYLGRTAAFWATLLFAVCTPAVEFSRLLWQQDFLPPLLALWLGSLFAGVTHGRRGWFAANVGLLALVTMLHPVAALLAPATVAAWLLSPRRPQWGEYVLTAGELGLLAAPTLVWELHSGWVDLGALRAYSSHSARANLDVLRNLYYALGVTSAQPGTGTLYGRLAGAAAAVAALTCGLLLAGYALFSVRAATSLMRAAHERGGEGAARRPHLTRAIDALRHVEPRWRCSAVLWLAVTVPIVAMVRHNSSIYPHYFIVLYPSAFLAFGWAMQWIRDSTGARLRCGRATIGDDGEGGMKTHCVPQAALLSTLCVALAGSAILGQVAQTVIFTASVEGQGFSTASGYGYPLDEMLRAEQTLDQLQQRAHAGLAVVVTPEKDAGDYHRNLTRLLVSENPSRTGLSGNCLVLPPAGDTALYVTTERSQPASRFVASLPSTRLIRELPMPGDQPLQFFTVNGLPSRLPGEVAVAPRRFDTLAGPALQLEGYELARPDLLQLRWRVLSSTGPDLPNAWYDVHAQMTTQDGTADQPLGITHCEPTHWIAGETLFTWTSLAHTPDGVPNARLAVQVYRGAHADTVFTSHGLRFISAQQVVSPVERLTPETSALDTSGERGSVLPALGYDQES
jgi:hypothetical protein